MRIKLTAGALVLLASGCSFQRGVTSRALSDVEPRPTPIPSPSPSPVASTTTTTTVRGTTTTTRRATTTTTSTSSTTSTTSTTMAPPPPPVDGTQTTGGVNWLDPLKYAKPAFIPIAIPNEATCPNKYYVDLSSGAGTACTQSSPCSFGGVLGKPGTAGGPAYIYVRGSGPLYIYNPSKTLFGAPGSEIVIKPWPGFTATFTGGNTQNFTGDNIHHVIFDGGPDMGIKFTGATKPNADDVAFRVNSNDITMYRVQATCNNTNATGLFYTTADNVNNFKIINSEMYGCLDGGNDQQSAVYLGGCACSSTCYFNHFVFRNNIVRDMGGEGLEINPRGPSDGVEISGNAIHHVGYQTCGAGWGCRPAVTMDGGSCGKGATRNATVANNLMWDLGGGCVWWRSVGPLYGYNNTCLEYGNGKGQISSNEGMSTWQGGGGSSTTLWNNIIVSSSGYNAFDNSNFKATNNLCKAGDFCGSASQRWSTSTVLSTDQDSIDFLKLGASSEAVDHGTAVPTLAVDYANSSRSQGAGVDIGAFERVQ